EAKKGELAAASADQLTRSQGRADSIEGSICEISVPVTEEGALYGSVGTREIADAFIAINVDIDKSEVQLPDGPIKEVGDHLIVISVHPEVSAEVTVKVLAE
ncbi:50S ribosomal protein L9, partial [Gammaproteobacteria bacterium]|nr:50S ribosomal protein L9 [Gammaproteobacteria bacterium]